MPALEDQIRIDIDKITKRTGHKHLFELVLTSDILQTKDGSLVDVQIEAGHPPKLVIPLVFLARVSVLKKNGTLYRDRLERALEKLPKMDRTLSNNINRNLSLILAKDAKIWKKVRNDQSYKDIPDSCFEVEYVVKVREKISGMQQTVVGKNVHELVSEAKHRLSRIIQNDESMLDFRDLVEELGKPITIPVEPKVIQLASKSNDVDTLVERRDY